jgi:hypothetical protein
MSFPRNQPNISPRMPGRYDLEYRLPEDNNASLVHHESRRLLLLVRDQMCDTVSLAHPAGFVRDVIINPSLFPLIYLSPRLPLPGATHL